MQSCRARSAGWLVAIGILTGACGERPVEAPVSDDLLSKEDFTGEWFFRATVVAVSDPSGISFVGLAGDLERVRWSIREDELVAYRSFDPEHADAPPDYTPIAAFGVTHHGGFEGLGAAPPMGWIGQPRMRVDWSRNLAETSYALTGVARAVPGEPYEGSRVPHDPYHDTVERDAINVVGHYTLFPDPVLCADLPYDVDGCAPRDALIKLSILRIDGQAQAGQHVLRSYVGREWPDALERGEVCPRALDSSGEDLTIGECTPMTFPVATRFGFHRHRELRAGAPLPTSRFWVHRRDIWADGYVTYSADPAYRETTQISYVLAAGLAEELDTASIDGAIDGWDRALRDAVAARRALRPEPGEVPEVPPILTVRPNACERGSVTRYAQEHDLAQLVAGLDSELLDRDALQAACAAVEVQSRGREVPFTWEKRGDLRYDLIDWVDSGDERGPLASTTRATDPLTGEIISAGVTLYGASIERLATYAADAVTAITPGREGAAELRDRLDAARRAAYAPISPAALDGLSEHFSTAAEQAGTRVGAAEWFPWDIPSWFRPGAPLAVVRDPDRVARAGIGTTAERGLLTGEAVVQALLGEAASMEPPEDFSPLAYLLDEPGELVRSELLARDVMMVGPEDWRDPDLDVWAAELAGLDLSGRFDTLRRLLIRGLVLHELGHTLGLRHNLAGSYDAFNYQPAFWASWDPADGTLRDRTPETFAPTGAQHHAYASVMDIDVRRLFDPEVTVAPYDRAAVAFAYLDLLEVLSPSRAPLSYDLLMRLHAPADLPVLFGASGGPACDSRGDCYTGLESATDLLSWNNAARRAMDLRARAIEALEAGSGAAWQAFTYQSELNADEARRFFLSYALGAIDETGRTESCTAEDGWCGLWERRHTTTEYELERIDACVEDRGCGPDLLAPYRFCSDAERGALGCAAHDRGATSLEVARDAAARHFARAWLPVVSTADQPDGRDAIDRYRFAVYATATLGLDKQGTEVPLSRFPVGRDWQAASAIDFDRLARILLRPAPGEHCLSTEPHYSVLQPGEACPGETIAFCRPVRGAALHLLVPGDLCTGEDVPGCLQTSFVYRAATPDVPCPSVDGAGLAPTASVPAGSGLAPASAGDDDLRRFADALRALAAFTGAGRHRGSVGGLVPDSAHVSYWDGGLHDEVLSVIGAVVGAPSDGLGWLHDGAIAYAPVLDVYDGDDPAGVPIAPAAEPTLAAYAMILASARLGVNRWDAPDFSDYARVCTTEDAVCLVALGGDGSELVAYDDPVTGETYLAALTDRPAAAIGARLVLAAAGTATRAYLPALDALEATDPADPSYAARQRELEEAERELEARNEAVQLAHTWGRIVEEVWR